MIDIDAYLRRLGLPHPGRPSIEGLFALQRAHVTRVPYESLEIFLGRPTTVDPEESVARILSGRGGYCYHLNGAFALLLETLGYPVRRHLGGIFSARTPAAGANGYHLALTVEAGGREWYADVGLGDALLEPMPLEVGEARQGPFRYRLERSPLVPGGWRLRHDPAAGSFDGMDFASETVGMDAFAEVHRFRSTSPSSVFVTVPKAGRPTPDGLEFVQGCLYRRYDRDGLSRTVLTSPDEWFGVLSDRFGLSFPPADRQRIWPRLWASHLEFVGRTDTPAAVTGSG